MITTISEALSDTLIAVIYRDDGSGLVGFQLGELPVTVTARICRESATRYVLEVSHRIKTPIQADSYLPAFRDCRSPGAALDELTSVFCSYYKMARQKGHQPNVTWLVPNKYFEL